MEHTKPCLISQKTLKSEFNNVQNIYLTSDNFSLGRGLKNSVVIPFLAISRSHCIFRKTNKNEWLVEDYSTFGIEINGIKVGKGNKKSLMHEDVITLEPSQEFMYKFINTETALNDVPSKRIKLEDTSDLINNVKMKFEHSQSCEIKHIEDKIQNAKQMQATSRILKQQLHLDMNRQIQQLENNYTVQIENLKGEKNEVANQKVLLLKERDIQLAAVREEMEGKILNLMEQIQKHNETESELLSENNQLKEKLLKEREEFLCELNRESTSKHDLLKNLETKMREQEEIRIKEKRELEGILRAETERLKQAKEKELRELEEQKKMRELELLKELDEIKKNLEERVEQTEHQRLKAERQLNEQMEKLKKDNDEDKIKMEQLVHEREELQKKLAEAEQNSGKSLEELKVKERETELAVVAADKSTEVINSLQEQLEKTKTQLKSLENEKETLLENLNGKEKDTKSTSKQKTLDECNDIMESELQCSICAELFVTATTLSCSHTFCKYCITMWKKKKKDCPICRSPIISECKSIVLDSFIEKMVDNMSKEMKEKRLNVLKAREELESALARQPHADNNRGSSSYGESIHTTEAQESSEEGEEEGDNWDSGDYESPFSYWTTWFRRGLFPFQHYSDGGSDDLADYINGSALRVDRSTDAAVSSLDLAHQSSFTDSRRFHGTWIPSLPNAYYGGYGHCYRCGAFGHWSPGCPFR